MNWSKALIPTLKEEPAEAITTSHRLLLKGGYIRRAAAGTFTYLPLGWRVVKRIVQIMREEIDRIGGQELLAPSLTPAQLWQKSGRWDEYGGLMFRVKDRKGRWAVLCPTHEEVIAEAAAAYIHSYRDLPQLWYHISVKFRDELRPRAGLLRVREFLMKDSYSLDANNEGLHVQYEAHREAYRRIFGRCGLDVLEVTAASGEMGGSVSEEFMVQSPTGEDSVALCRACGWAGNVEAAPVASLGEGGGSGRRAFEEVNTPGVRTVEQVCSFLGVNPDALIKAVVLRCGEGMLLALVRGDRQVSEPKLSSLVKGPLSQSEPEEIERLFGAPAGFVGPIGMEGKVRIIADSSVKTVRGGVTGANREDYHYVGVTPGENFKPDSYGDISLVEEGDPCPSCGKELDIERTIEVGHIFKLGTKYSDALGVQYADEEGNLKPVVMGSYGIGPGRVLSAVIETLSDDRGPVWPVTIAPYDVLLIQLFKEADEPGQELAARLGAVGLEVLRDERPDASPGVKFRDADLTGIPFRVILGRKLKEGKVEIETRASGGKTEVTLDALAETVAGMVKQAYEALQP